LRQRAAALRAASVKPGNRGAHGGRPATAWAPSAIEDPVTRQAGGESQWAAQITLRYKF
jgi:hypothetical protein